MATLVTLIDGQVVMSDAEEWRHECLAREVLAKPLAERRAWLTGYEQKRGAEAADRLKSTIAVLHEKARAARASGA